MVLVLCARKRVGEMIGTSDALNFSLLPAPPRGDSVTLAKSLPPLGASLSTAANQGAGAGSRLSQGLPVPTRLLRGRRKTDCGAEGRRVLFEWEREPASAASGQPPRGPGANAKYGAGRAGRPRRQRARVWSLATPYCSVSRPGSST